MLYQWIISLPMMLCFFWSIFWLVRWYGDRSEPRVKLTITLFFIAAAVLYTDHWLYFSERQSFVGTWTYFIANLSVYPIYYTYLRALTRVRPNAEMYLLFLPAVLIAILYPLDVHFRMPHGGNLLLFARICFAIEVIWVWWRGYRVLRETRARLDDIYSDDRSYLLHPTYLIQHLLGITAAFSMCLNLLGRDFFAESMMVSIPAIIMSALLFGIGYVAAHTTLPQETIHTEAPQAKETTIEETDALMQAITTVLREQKLFALPDLTIQDLASAVHSNRTYVSQCINRRTGLSFSQYVARYRVEHAQQILRDSGYGTDKEAIMDAMTSSGFSSDQTFYRVFKEITGETPLQYRHNNLQ